MKRLFVMLCILVTTSVAHASDESAFENLELIISPLPHKVSVGYPHDMNDDYYFVKNISRIFFQDVPLSAKIVEVDISKNEMKFTLENKKYGKGVIKIYSEKNLKEASNDEIKLVLHRSISDEKLATVVADTKSKTFHLATCNHLPQIGYRAYFSKKTALANGFKECGSCFLELMYLPDYAIEKVLQKKASSELRHYNPVLLNSSEQSRVERIGNSILDGWPYPLIGYRYKFTVVESKEVNAYALAAGSIFLTTGLLNVVENDSELEAVLAHEIAHVERRHALQTYRRLVLNQQNQQAMAMLGGIAMGAAVASNNNTALGVTAGVSLAAILAVSIHESGYSKENEKEADDYAVRYFDKTGKDMRALKSMFTKLMYNNLCTSLNPDPKSLTHPAIGNRIRDLDKLKTIYPKDIVYHVMIDNKPVQINALSISERNDESEILLKVSDLSLLQSSVSSGGILRIINGEKYIELLFDENVTLNDSWGGGIVVAKGNTKGLDIIDSTNIEIYKAFKDQRGDTSGQITRKFIKGAYY